jgi:hypothetical protein
MVTPYQAVPMLFRQQDSRYVAILQKLMRWDVGCRLWNVVDPEQLAERVKIGQTPGR